MIPERITTIMGLMKAMQAANECPRREPLSQVNWEVPPERVKEVGGSGRYSNRGGGRGGGRGNGRGSGYGGGR